MVRKVAETKEEREAAKEAINELAEAYREEFGDAFEKRRRYIGDEFGDAGYYFNLSDVDARRDVEHSEIRIRELAEIFQEHGFRLSDLAYSSRLIREREKDFVHEPDTEQVLRLSVFYEYPEHS